MIYFVPLFLKVVCGSDHAHAHVCTRFHLFPEKGSPHPISLKVLSDQTTHSFPHCLLTFALTGQPPPLFIKHLLCA